MPRNPTAETFEATNEQYHARGEASHSTIDEFREDPAFFNAVHIARTQPKKEPSEAMQFGTRVHSWVLERESVVKIPKEALSKSGSKHGDAWKEFERSQPGKMLLKPDECEPLEKIEAELRAHEKANAILYGNPGMREMNIRWQDRVTMLWVRCRIDCPHDYLLGDLKTAKAITPQEFASACNWFGYHRQAAHYQDGYEALTGQRLPFVFIAVRNTPPWSVLVYEMDNDFIEIGRRQNLAALEHLAECHATGIWKPKGWGKILTLKAPYGAKFENQWEVA